MPTEQVLKWLEKEVDIHKVHHLVLPMIKILVKEIFAEHSRITLYSWSTLKSSPHNISPNLLITSHPTLVYKCLPDGPNL